MFSDLSDGPDWNFGCGLCGHQAMSIRELFPCGCAWSQDPTIPVYISPDELERAKIARREVLDEATLKVIQAAYDHAAYMLFEIIADTKGTLKEENLQAMPQ